jgi:hypothetical protein
MKLLINVSFRNVMAINPRKAPKMIMLMMLMMIRNQYTEIGL